VKSLAIHCVVQKGSVSATARVRRGTRRDLNNDVIPVKIHHTRLPLQDPRNKKHPKNLMLSDVVMLWRREKKYTVVGSRFFNFVFRYGIGGGVLLSERTIWGINVIWIYYGSRIKPE
jgi:hypothetical protein